MKGKKWQKSMDVTVAIIMPYQLGSFLKLHVIMSAVKCRSLTAGKEKQDVFHSV